MQAALEKLIAQNAEQAAHNQKLLQRLDELLTENRLLKQKLQFLMKRLFGRKSEKLDRSQMELLLGGFDPMPDDDDDPPPTPPAPRRRPRGERKTRLPEDLPVEEVFLDPDAVKQDPNGYRCIGQEVTEELDVVPTRYFLRRIIRRKFVSKTNRDLPPMLAPLPPRVIDNSLASAGLLTDIVLKKYVDHLPLYRQEQILRARHGIGLSRKTMAGWMEAAADWLRPIYAHIREDLRSGAYLQVDETPIRFCLREGGGSGSGYFWVYHRPGAEVLFEWHTSRAADCLKNMLEDFRGTVQCDGYGAYLSFAKHRPDIELAGCWAHARRKFFEAKSESPAFAGWILHQIGLLYAIEKALKGKGPAWRAAVRAAQSGPILARLHKAILMKRERHIPKSLLRSAMEYVMAFWPQLTRYRDDGRLEIDNNLVVSGQ
jgi:transposase